MFWLHHCKKRLFSFHPSKKGCFVFILVKKGLLRRFSFLSEMDQNSEKRVYSFDSRKALNPQYSLRALISSGVIFMVLGGGAATSHSIWNSGVLLNSIACFKSIEIPISAAMNFLAALERWKANAFIDMNSMLWVAKIT